MSFLNPNYTEPCLSWCSSPFTPAAWRACTFQSSSPQINWVFFPLVSSPDIFWESKVIISWVEAAGRRRDSHASDSRDVIWRFCPERSLSPRCVQSHVRRFIRLTRALLRMISIFQIHNYTLYFIIPGVWTVVTVAVFLDSPTFKSGRHLAKRWKVIRQKMSQSLSLKALGNLSPD